MLSRLSLLPFKTVTMSCKDSLFALSGIVEKAVSIIESEIEFCKFFAALIQSSLPDFFKRARSNIIPSLLNHRMSRRFSLYTCFS